MKEQNIAIITARGGSKRIPKKNIKDFCGEPIIAYSIRAALESEVFDEVMVSTDSEEIAEIAKQYGASVPFMRSEATSNDYATTADVIREVLSEYDKAGRKFRYACCIYPTAPFVTGKKLRKAMEMLEIEKRDSVIPVVPFSFPPLRGMVINDSKLEYKWAEFASKRSQDLEEIYHDCGQFYALCVDKFQNTGKLVMGNTMGVVISELEVQDIDNEIDWELAEIKYRLLRERGRV